MKYEIEVIKAGAVYGLNKALPVGHVMTVGGIPPGWKNAVKVLREIPDGEAPAPGPAGVVQTPEQEADAIRAELDAMGAKYKRNFGLEKLREALAAAKAEQAEALAAEKAALVAKIAELGGAATADDPVETLRDLAAALEAAKG